MKYEIEMLSLGNADSSIVRFYNMYDQEYVILIDAGNPGDGKKVLNHINYYTKQKYIDLAICTHPDRDHIGGFFEIVGNIKINEFWIHDPSLHVDLNEVKKSLSQVNIYKSLKYLTESFDNSKNLLTLIDKNKIPRFEPFKGKIHDYIPIKIVGPSIEYYENLLSGFRDIDHLYKEAEFIEKSISETNLEDEMTLSKTIDENNDKSNENNSSAICTFAFDKLIYLFTADAGPDAFEEMIKTYDLSNIFWMQVPHHGSKYNLTSSLIKYFNPHVAYISASGSKKYPSKAIVNAFKKINCRVYSTKDGNKLHNSIEDRHDYIAAVPL